MPTINSEQGTHSLVEDRTKLGSVSKPPDEISINAQSRPRGWNYPLHPDHIQIVFLRQC